MKASRMVSIAILSLLLAIAAPAYAQQELRGEKRGHPDQRQGKHEQARSEGGHVQQQPQHPGKKQQQDQHVQQAAWQRHGSQNWDSDHRI